MKIIALGSPGVGKGTYISLVKDVLKLPHISTGDLFRDNLKNSLNELSSEYSVDKKEIEKLKKAVNDEFLPIEIPA